MTLFGIQTYLLAEFQHLLPTLACLKRKNRTFGTVPVLCHLFTGPLSGLLHPFEQILFHLPGLYRRISPHESIFGAEQP